ncbi:MAG TPA: S-layer homology domain-containing protein [Acholeplasma sp.]|nr:S-layer homology domain-containing protein [Acholeplasma sp.]
MKKVLSLVLVIAMVLSSFSFAFAANFEDVEGDYEEAVNVLTALGVVTGYEDGTFRPERIVTRAEMAKLIVEILGYGDLVAGSASNFADTQGHWADPWIALAAGRGLVIGTGDGNFTPDRQVSYDEAITMVVRALGYTDDSNELKGMTWPTNFKVKASELDLLDGVKTLAGGADRGGVAQLLFNALDAALVTVDVDGNVTYIFDTIDKENREARILLSRLADKVPLTVNADHLDPDHKNYKGDVVDLTKYMYQNITVYEKDDVVVYVDGVDSLVLEGTVVANEDDSITVEDAKEKEFEFDLAAKDIDVFYNGNEVTYDDIFEANDDLEDAEVILVLESKTDGVKVESGDKIDVNKQQVAAMILRFATVTVKAEEDYEKDAVEILAYDEDVVLPVNDDDEVDFNKLVVKGAVDSLEDIEEDDVLTLFYGKGEVADDVKLEIVVSRDTVEGKVTKVDSSKAYIDGKGYEFNKDAAAKLNIDVVVTTEGLFYLDYEGKIFDVEDISEVVAKDYAIVIQLYDGYETEGDKPVKLADPKVKLLTASGEKITYVFDLEQNEDSDVKIEDLKIKTDIVPGDLVKYNVNKDNEIDKIEKETRSSGKVFTTGSSFNLANNAVIFSLDTVKVDDSEVVEADDLDDEITGYVVRENGKIVAVVATDGVGKADALYALISGARDKAIYDADEDEAVALYTAYVDGEKIEYLGTSKNAKAGLVPKVVELKLKGGKVDDAILVDDEYDEGKVKVVTGTALEGRITNFIEFEEGDTELYLADDVVVYVLKEGGTKFDKVGKVSDIRGQEFIAYNFNSDKSDDFDVIVVVK